jgi:tetratricopeptide (TPR) repeat protein
MKNLAALYVDQRRYAEAEPLLRECLGLRRAALPGDDRFIAITQNLLGDCLTALGRYADAEPLLLDSYEQLRANPDAPAEQVRQALERIIGLYHAWGKPGRAAEWRAKPEQYRATTQPAMLRPGSGAADRADGKDRSGPTGP